MTTVLIAVVSGLLGLGGLVAGAIYYVRRAASNAVSVGQLEAAQKMDADRADAADKAAAAARATRLQEANAKADRVTTASDAADLLRQATGADDPKLN